MIKQTANYKQQIIYPPMDILRLVKTRRSVRKFKKGKVPGRIVNQILEAGRWAPSGLNNQPWRFIVLEGGEKEALAAYTHYAYIIKGADKVILVFLDRESSYDYEKDLMAVGASIENMLLCTHAYNLGACWLGEILKKREAIRKFLKVPSRLQLEAVIALGKPRRYPRQKKRKKLKSLMIKSSKYIRP